MYHISKAVGAVVMPRKPEYIDILNDPGFDRFSNCCPNCHRFPGERQPDGSIRFPCGSVYDLSQGIADKHCEAAVMDAEMALYEAASMHFMFAESPHQFLNKPDRQRRTLPMFNNPPSFLDGSLSVQYLFWDTVVLFSVIDNLEQAVGTISEWHGDMNMVWVSNRDVFEEGFVILGWFVHADSRGIMFGQAVQMRDHLGGEPLVLWSQGFCWGDPLETREDAAIYLIYSWLHQPYVGLTDGIHRPRHVRRRAEKEGRTLGNIKVIEFRKPESARHIPTESDGPKRELHCCFERTGYSRRQPYGPKSSLRRIQWIAPTLVGDPSKPFKARGQTLYRVSR